MHAHNEMNLTTPNCRFSKRFKHILNIPFVLVLLSNWPLTKASTGLNPQGLVVESEMLIRIVAHLKYLAVNACILEELFVCFVFS